MSVIGQLDGAELVIGDEDLGLMFVWYGTQGVHILNEAGEELSYFSITGTYKRVPTVREVSDAIKRYRAEMMAEDDS